MRFRGGSIDWWREVKPKTGQEEASLARLQKLAKHNLAMAANKAPIQKT